MRAAAEAAGVEADIEAHGVGSVDRRVDNTIDCVLLGPQIGYQAKQVKENGCVDDRTRMELSQEAFAHTAAYDAMIKEYLLEQLKK